jgi:putative transposase
MPRRARLALAGVAWHIIQRGNNRSACFYAEEDYRLYLDTLQEQAEKYGCAVHAYVLMTNHVHLLLTPETADGPSLLMKHLGQRYVQYINRHYKRSGTLWEGRFRSCLAQDPRYVLGCYRYIELNPVRAGMVAQPSEYRWSSYHVNGNNEPSRLIRAHVDYQSLAADALLRAERYRTLFSAHLDLGLIEQIRSATNGNFVLGNDRFRDEVERMLKRRVVPGRSGRPLTRGVN